jgi:putative mycofactocin binding protein MftB
MSPAVDLQPAGLDLDRPWRLHPRVALREESFGALAYHFGTRRLSFLKSCLLRDVVAGLEGHPSARAACRQAGVCDEELPAYTRALDALARSGMIEPRVGA